MRRREVLGGDRAGLVAHPLAPGARGTADQRFTLKAPRLWEGRKSPYLYRVQSDVVANGRVIDSQSVPLGVRTVAVKPDGTFLLNGNPYRLYGVNLQHPTRFGRGPIVTQAEIDEDLKLFDEMGVTGIRLAHMQHPQRVYDRADELGILILTEVPLIDDHDQSDEFRINLVQQMRELIAHPQVQAVRLSSCKPDVYPDCEAVGVEIFQTKSPT